MNTPNFREQEPDLPVYVDMANRSEVDPVFSSRYRRSKNDSMSDKDILITDLYGEIAEMSGGRMKFNSRDKLPGEIQVSQQDLSPEVRPRVAEELSALNLSQMQALSERIALARAEKLAQLEPRAQVPTLVENSVDIKC